MRNNCYRIIWILITIISLQSLSNCISIETFFSNENSINKLKEKFNINLFISTSKHSEIIADKNTKTNKNGINEYVQRDSPNAYSAANPNAFKSRDQTSNIQNLSLNLKNYARFYSRLLFQSYPKNAKVKNDILAFGNYKYGQLGNRNSEIWKQPNQLSHLSKAKGILAASKHSFVLLENDSVYGFGSNEHGELGDGTITERKQPVPLIAPSENLKVSQISSYLDHTMIIIDGKLYGVGKNTEGQLGTGDMQSSKIFVPTSDVLKDKHIKQVAVGSDFTISLDTSGSVYASGTNLKGELGLKESILKEMIPQIVQFDGQPVINQIFVAISHSFAIDQDGRVYCWGQNNFGQCGTRDMKNVFKPTLMNSEDFNSKRIIYAHGGHLHSLVVDTVGDVYVCGSNNLGQLGIPDITQYVLTPQLLISTQFAQDKVIKVSAGPYHSFLLTQHGKVYAFGNNDYSQLGTGFEGQNIYVPTEVASEGLWKIAIDISTGASHTLVLSDDGIVYGFGSRKFLIYDDDFNIRVPQIVFNNSEYFKDRNLDVSFEAADANDHSLLLHSSRKMAVAFGSNNFGQLGSLDAMRHQDIPITLNFTLKDEADVVQVCTGASHSGILDSIGRLYTFGSNRDGQLGNGESSDSHVPKEVQSLLFHKKKLIHISMGDKHTLAIDSDGDAYSFGSNTYGQLGVNHLHKSLLPIAVSRNSAIEDKQVRFASAGSFHSILLDNEGRVYTFGKNDMGQLGIGTSEWNSNLAKKVDLSDFSDDIRFVLSDAGEDFTILLSDKGRIFGFGSNFYGQIAQNSIENSNKPLPIVGSIQEKFIVQIACGLHHVLALEVDGQVHGWGRNDHFQLAMIDSKIPTPVNLGLPAAQFIVAGKFHSLLVTQYTCLDHWHGSYCDVPECFGKRADASDVCSGFGRCVDHDQCQCNEGYFGISCRQYLFFFDSSVMRFLLIIFCVGATGVVTGIIIFLIVCLLRRIMKSKNIQPKDKIGFQVLDEKYFDNEMELNDDDENAIDQETIIKISRRKKQE